MQGMQLRLGLCLLGALALGLPACGDDGGGGGSEDDSGSGTEGTTTDASATTPTATMTMTATMTADGTGSTSDADSSTGTPPATGDSGTGDSGTGDSGTGDSGTGDSGDSGTTGGGADEYPACDVGNKPVCPEPYDECYDFIAGYTVCTAPCQDANECPMPGSGDATVVCAGVAGDQCLLDCGNGETCPNGMECQSIMNFDRCVWAE